MSNVVNLNARANEGILKLLDHVREEVENGNVTGMVFVLTTNDGWRKGDAKKGPREPIVATFQTIEQPDFYSVVGAMEQLKHDMLKERDL